MGIYIKIIKYKQDISTFYYSILTDTNIFLYYLALDAETKNISFYTNKNFNEQFESLINMRVGSRATEAIEKIIFLMILVCVRNSKKGNNAIKSNNVTSY